MASSRSDLLVGTPELLDGLVLMSTSSRVDVAGTLDGMESVGGTVAREAAAAFFSDASAPGVVDHYMAICIGYYTHGDIDTEVLGRVTQRPKTMMHFFSKGAEFERVDLSADLRAIRTQTLVIHGENDVIFPPYLAQELYGTLALPEEGAAGFQRKQLVLLPDCGHLSEQDSPAQIVSTITRFFGLA